MDNSFTANMMRSAQRIVAVPSGGHRKRVNKVNECGGNYEFDN